ncbi:SCAN domain-containing protein 1 isoform X1 [Cricetulus griseus]|uniref:SCAN domain-containing protein 1 n=1 Tax=Cricetulus griseus TaxID=10029 RepID=A0A8C2LJ05_CRIGR|nr:SCAN domain-containing protein 1 isoform X1 [Cricetulus griseus]XP_035302389.1 SCAN domain-containing protein 1 isoform X2 [Cricetulus griseus]
MASPEPSPAARSPAAPPGQQEGAGDGADPEPAALSPAAPELPGTPAPLDAALQAEAAPRPGASRPGPETFRQRFRQFRYQDAAGPREAFRQLRELSRQWLRPDIRTKEQIVEMLVQEQLQAILPEAARARRLRRRADVRITG